MTRAHIPYNAAGIAPGEWTRNAHGRSTIEHSRSIARLLGTYRAACYLRKRGWSIEAALHILTTKR